MSVFTRLAFVLTLAAAPAFAQEPTPAAAEESVVVEAEVVVEEAMVEPAVVESPVCCPIEVVAVRTKLSARRFLRCAGPEVPMAVCVDNPADCTCTLYEVPLCVPCCCEGAPSICPVPAILPGRGKVELCWDCGYVATVTFLKHGGVIITYTAG